MIDRRSLMISASSAAIVPNAAFATRIDLRRVERDRVVGAADAYLREAPSTITSIPAPRSPGGAHDYYSEADYWWPDPSRPSGPYVRRDGFSNPAKFDGHRDALIAFGIRMPALAAAWRLTGERRYARAAVDHLRAWFVDPRTRMSPDLAHAQAIIGRDMGRAIGIIDTLQVVEVAQAAKLLGDLRSPDFDTTTRAGVSDWFSRYLEWLLTSPAGIEERDQRNNHGTCWLLQCAAFADLLDDRETLAGLRTRLRTVIVPDQIAADGQQPRELSRTKPYGYSLFNLDVLATACQVLSPASSALWTSSGKGGGSIADAIGFMAPFIRDKARWQYPPDVEHFDALPVRHPALLFAGLALDHADWIALWRTLDPDPTDREIVRNFTVRQPILWTSGDGHHAR